MSETYVALDRIWHTGDRCYHEPGAVVTMNHFEEPADIQMLVDKGVIVPWKEGEPWPILSEDEEEEEEEPVLPEPEPPPVEVVEDGVTDWVEYSPPAIDWAADGEDIEQEDDE